MATFVYIRRLRHGMVAAALLAFLAGCAGPASRSSLPGGQAYRGHAVVIDDDLRSEVVLTALALLDTRYKYGGSTPASGFDCSGFVAYVFKKSSRNRLPHNTETIARISQPISKNNLRPGDFVFFNTLHQPYSHMGIYIGDGHFINAPSTGGHVRIDSLHNPYYAQRFDDARTLFRL